MADSINAAFERFLSILKGNTPQELNKMLNDFGISKEEVIAKINQIDRNELSDKVNSKEFSDFLSNFSQEDIEKFKNAHKKDEIEELYKSFLKAKEGK